MLMHMLLFNSAGNLNLNGSLGLGVMPLSIQGVIKYQTMISIAYLGSGCVRTTLSSIWILYSPLYKSPLSWTIFNSDNVHVLGTYNDGFNSYSCWLTSKFLSNCFLIQKKVHYRRYIKCIFHCSIYLLCCKKCMNATILLRCYKLLSQFYFVSIHLIATKNDWCYSS